MKIVCYLPNFYQYFLVSPHSITSVPAFLLLTAAYEPYRSDEKYLLMQKFNHPSHSLHNPLHHIRANRFAFRMQGGQHNPRITYEMSQSVCWDFWKHKHWSTNFEHAAVITCIQWLYHSKSFRESCFEFYPLNEAILSRQPYTRCKTLT